MSTSSHWIEYFKKEKALSDAVKAKTVSKAVADQLTDVLKRMTN